MAFSGFLKTIYDIKKEQIAFAKSKISPATVRSDAEHMPGRPDFLAAMKKSSAEDIGIIAEIKKASPSKGDICPDLNVPVYAEHYRNAGARAISVLTEDRYFKGSLKDLETVCGVCEDVPVLRKDFTISSYQVYEARKAGASSILLITTMMSKDQLKDFIDLVRELKMEPLVEITSEKELEIAYQCGAKVVDINNRNLQTLKTDKEVSKRISQIIGPDIIPVEASGIKAFKDIQEGLACGMYNFLVGESIVRSADPEAFIKSLRGKQKEEN